MIKWKSRPPSLSGERLVEGAFGASSKNDLEDGRVLSGDP